MKVHIGGTRGGSPVPDPAFAKYGGDTTAFRVEGSSGHSLFIDAGTGLRNFADELADAHRNGGVKIIFSHFHLDHLDGATLLPRMLPSGARVQVYSGRHLGGNAAEALQNLYRPPVWPVCFETMGIKLWPREFDANARVFLRHGSLSVSALPTVHPGASTAFRFTDSDGSSCVIATDIEWEEMDTARQAAFLDFASDSSVLLFDGEYGADAYASRRGWGHSTREQAVAVADATRSPLLRILHHSSHMDDGGLRAVDRVVGRRRGAALARQGDVLSLP